MTIISLSTVMHYRHAVRMDHCVPKISHSYLSKRSLQLDPVHMLLLP